MNQYITLSEYIISPNHPVSVEVADKILRYHLFPMNRLRNQLGFPIIVSAKSGYRHPEYERMKGRKDSTHEFREIDYRDDPGYGAADYRVAPAQWVIFGNTLVKDGLYNRLIFYPNATTPFVHGDYRFLREGRFFYIMHNEIQRVSQDEFLQAIQERF